MRRKFLGFRLTPPVLMHKPEIAHLYAKAAPAATLGNKAMPAIACNIDRILPGPDANTMINVVLGFAAFFAIPVIFAAFIALHSSLVFWKALVMAEGFMAVSYGFFWLTWKHRSAPKERKLNAAVRTTENMPGSDRYLKKRD